MVSLNWKDRIWWITLDSVNYWYCILQCKLKVWSTASKTPFMVGAILKSQWDECTCITIASYYYLFLIFRWTTAFFSSTYLDFVSWINLFNINLYSYGRNWIIKQDKYLFWNSIYKVPFWRIAFISIKIGKLLSVKVL